MRIAGDRGQIARPAAAEMIAVDGRSSRRGRPWARRECPPGSPGGAGRSLRPRKPPGLGGGLEIGRIVQPRRRLGAQEFLLPEPAQARRQALRVLKATMSANTAGSVTDGGVLAR